MSIDPLTTIISTAGIFHALHCSLRWLLLLLHPRLWCLLWCLCLLRRSTTLIVQTLCFLSKDVVPVWIHAH